MRLISRKAWLVYAHTEHLAAHIGAVAAVEIDQPKQIAVMACIHVPVDERGREVGAATMRKVHRQKGDFSRHVGAAKARRELHAIEQLEPPPFDANAGGVQVAVPIADSFVRDATLQ